LTILRCDARVSAKIFCHIGGEEMPNDQEKHHGEVAVPVRIQGAENIPILYANYIFVTHTNDEFFLTLAQLHPPYLISPTKKDIEELRSIPATVVSRTAFTPGKFKELIDVLQKNYQQYSKQKGSS
jgi:hypothetical protein